MMIETVVRRSGAWLFLLALVAPAVTTSAQSPDTFLGVRVETERNRVLLVIPEPLLGTDLLYVNTLATGAGVNRLGLDRGQTGVNAVVRLERRGNRVLMRRDNWNVRATTAGEAGARAAAESFPTSVIAFFPLVEDQPDDRASVVVDASAFFLGDAYDVIGRVRTAGQGTLRLDRERSWIDEDATGAFPRNVEVRAVLTFVTDAPGADLRRAAPDGGAVTLEQHHSLVALPDPAGFRPRAADGRSGLFSERFFDFSQGFDGTYRSGFTNRWRLVPRDVTAYLRGELVEPVQPVVYYLDRGIPEPYRTAFIEGGLWWNGVFEAAGFRNAFQIRDLPPGTSPLDARYPMIYWVHRAEPGPSVGPSYRDPRTGEIVSTVVRMDSYRSLVDYNIYAGLVPAAQGTLPVSAEAFVMARRRQHAAHEIGHTLGLAHNFIAATQDGASVMDYPFPRIELDTQGRIDISRAYRVGGGAWDRFAIRYAYTWFPDERSEAEGLARIMREGIAAGLRFITGNDAGPAGSIPGATLWIDGASGLEALERTARVRRLLVERFDERAIQPGEPMAMLNQRFAHVYLHHRYALEAAVKYIGGMEFTYASRGDGQTPTRAIPAADQRRALEMVLDALEPSALAVPDRVAALIPPSPFGTDGSEIWLKSAAGPAFDVVTLAGGLATEVVENLLHPERVHRLVLFHARDAAVPSLSDVVDRLVQRSWGAAIDATAAHQLLRRAVQRVVLNSLLDLAGNAQATPEVRAVAEYHLSTLRARLMAASGGATEDQALRAAALRDLDRYLAGQDDRAARSRFPVVPLPWP